MFFNVVFACVEGLLSEAAELCLRGQDWGRTRLTSVWILRQAGLTGADSIPELGYLVFELCVPEEDEMRQ